MAGPPNVGEAGFGLVEVMVAMFILVSVAVATTPFFVHALAGTASQGERQDAVSVATQRLEMVRSVNVGSLLRGRTASDVQTRLTNDRGLVDLSNEVTTSTANSDATSTSATSASAVIPVLDTQTIANHTFTVRTFINPCYRNDTDGLCTADPLHGTQVFRVTVDVSWPRPAADSCQSGRPRQCEYVVSTLRDATKDPTFNRNVSTPTVTRAATIPVVLHPLQGLYDGALLPNTVTLLGTGFVAGAVITSSDSGDTVGPVTSNTGTSATASYSPSAATGTRTFRLRNADGGNAAATCSAATCLVSSIAPRITAIPGGGSTVTRGSTVSLSLTGTDFYTSATTPASVSVVLKQTAAPSRADTVPATSVRVTTSATGTASLVIPATFPTGAATATVTLKNPDGLTAALALPVSVA